jgi:hypothetical protein
MASKYLQKYPIPGDFPQLLHDFTKEVLRDQPDDIFEYGYQYFKALEEVRNFCGSRLLHGACCCALLFELKTVTITFRESSSTLKVKERTSLPQETEFPLWAPLRRCQPAH